MFCNAAVKLKDEEEYSDVITIKEEYGKKGKTKEDIKRKFEYTFNKISSEKAKEIAKPLYEKALNLIEQ